MSAMNGVIGDAGEGEALGRTGSTAKTRNAGTKIRIGASRNTKRSRPRRDEVLLDEELEHVGDRLQQPRGPTRFGPMRTCMHAEDLALDEVRYGRRCRAATTETITMIWAIRNDVG